MSASSAPAELPVPDFYDPRHASAWGYRPDQQALFERATAWRAEHGLPAAAADRRQIHLLLIDVQKDFCFPEGALYVGGRSGRGALEDNDRTARFIYRNLGVISRLTCTLDTHYPYQIFSPEFWLDEQEQPPGPHREVSAAEVQAGKLRPNPAVADWVAHGDYGWLRKHAEHYCQKLGRRGKYRLYLWPPHCILGSEGHTLVGVVHEARMFHAYARRAPASIQVKGDTPLTEYYSALGPEVTTTFDGQPLAPRSRAFLETLTAADALIIAGQAASHCVKSTIDDLLGQVDPSLARKVYILRDCMSSVAVPDPARPGA
ncbi:MAG: cysteine hydrolase family protein, partial [Gemmatimonadetes bacterium]|nr:cysteine hydrolase family protein [Gemmatimonadota bacterium]